MLKRKDTNADEINEINYDDISLLSNNTIKTFYQERKIDFVKLFQKYPCDKSFYEIYLELFKEGKIFSKDLYLIFFPNVNDINTMISTSTINLNDIKDIILDINNTFEKEYSSKINEMKNKQLSYFNSLNDNEKINFSIGFLNRFNIFMDTILKLKSLSAKSTSLPHELDSIVNMINSCNNQELKFNIQTFVKEQLEYINKQK